MSFCLFASGGERRQLWSRGKKRQHKVAPQRTLWQRECKAPFDVVGYVQICGYMLLLCVFSQSQESHLPSFFQCDQSLEWQDVVVVIIVDNNHVIEMNSQRVSQRIVCGKEDVENLDEGLDWYIPQRVWQSLHHSLHLESLIESCLMTAEELVRVE